MKKHFFLLAVLLFILTVGWYYLPINIRDKAAAFLGIALRRDSGEIKRFVADVTPPQEPEKRRKVLFEELKKNVTEIKRRSATGVKTPKEKDESYPNGSPDIPNSSKAYPTDESTQELITTSEQIIEELEKTISDQSLGRKLTSRILDVIFPSQEESCKL